MLKWLLRFNHQKKQEGIMALDIGTESIKAVLFIIENKLNPNGEVIGKRAIIKGVGKSTPSASDIQSGFINDIDSIINRSKKAIHEAAKMAKIKPNKMVFGIAGDFIKGRTSSVLHKRQDSDTKINLSELSNIIHKSEWKAFADDRKLLSEEVGFSEIDFKLVDSAIVGITIDGYKVTNPLGFQGKEVEIKIFNSFSSTGQYEAIQNIIDQIGIEKTEVVSEPFAVSRGIHFGEKNTSLIYVDIGGGSTDVAIIKNNSILGSKMFAIGGRSITKRIALELNVSLMEAEKIKIAFTDNKLESKSKKIIENILKSDLELWLEGFTLTLSEFKEDKKLPSKILLAGGGANLPQIAEMLNKRKWYKKLPFQKQPATSLSKPTDLQNLIDETEQVKNHEDFTTLALVSYGLELFSEESIIQKTLKKVIGIMKV